jgi:hypothetical protein
MTSGMALEYFDAAERVLSTKRIVIRLDHKKKTSLPTVYEHVYRSTLLGPNVSQIIPVYIFILYGKF